MLPESGLVLLEVGHAVGVDLRQSGAGLEGGEKVLAELNKNLVVLLLALWVWA